mmetsp:Transcript_3677/g.8538  ORF Transcript_3677/g.8538 Transcript_3677/m.8538 type:complete len:145 (-) Transcript_3677:27-461(-)
MELKIYLPSGRCATVTVKEDATVAEVLRKAQDAFGDGFVRLLSADGCSLDPQQPVELLQSGGSLTAVYVRLPKVAATTQAFAAWCEGEVVTTWGHPDAGGDSCWVTHRLVNVTQIAATRRAFAAVADGSVVTWGAASYGGKTWL